MNHKRPANNPIAHSSHMLHNIANRGVQFIILLACVLGLAACSNDESSSGVAKTETNRSSSEGIAKQSPYLVIGVPGDAKTLDPAMAHDTESGQINELIYEGLIAFADDSLDLVPALAESWTVSEDGLVWTFKIREGVKFHDGTDLNADAVVFSIKRQLDENHPHHRAGGKMPYAEAFFTTIVDSVEATGTFEVVFKLKGAFTSFAANLACDASSIVSPAALEKWGEDFEAHPAGTGAYQLKLWNNGTKLELSANENYWGEKPVTKRLIFNVYAEPTQRLNALLAGEAHLITAVDPQYVNEIKAAGNLVIYRKPALSISYIEMNHDKEPFNNKLFRQALNYAVNKDYIVTNLMNGIGYVSVGGLPPNMMGALEEPVYPYDPEKAKQLLKESGVDLSKLKIEFKTYNRTRPYNPVGDRLAEVCKDYLVQVGINAELKIVDFTAYLEDRIAGNFMMGNIGWSSDNGQPDNTIFELFGKPSNAKRYHNETANALMKEAMVTQDDAKRADLYHQANEMIVDDAAVIFINHGMQMMAGSEKVHEFKLHPKGTHRFEPVWVEAN